MSVHDFKHCRQQNDKEFNLSPPPSDSDKPAKPDKKPAQLRDAIASLRKLAEGQLALHAPQMKFILVKNIAEYTFSS